MSLREDAARLRLSTARADLARVYPWLEAATAGLGLAPALLNAMHVALEEVVMNIAMHGFPAGETGEMTLEFAADDAAAVLRIEDAGAPFDQATAPPPPQAAATPGGRGLKLLRHYCKDMGYKYEAGRNQLTLRFPLAAG